MRAWVFVAILLIFSGRGFVGASCSPLGILGQPGVEISGNTCDSSNAIEVYAGDCTLQGVTYRGPEDCYGLILTEGNLVGFELEVISGDLAMAITTVCNDGETCLVNAVDNSVPGVDEIIPSAPFEPGVYYLYVDSACEAGNPEECPEECGEYRLELIGTNPSEPDLAVDLTVSSSVIAGTELMYTWTVTNASPFDATDVRLSAPLPVGASLSPGSVGCANSGGSILCDIGLLQANETEVRTVLVDVDASFTGPLSMTVSASAAEMDPNPSNNSAGVTTTVVSQADLSVTLATPGPAVAGLGAIYQLTVANAGPSAATAVTATLDLDDGVSLGTTTGGCVENGTGVPEVVWAITSLEPGESRVCIVNVEIPSSETEALDSDAEIADSESDTDSSNNSFQLTTPVEQLSDLIVLMSDTLDPVIAGADSFVYALTVTNLGPSDATDLEITGNLPAGVTSESASDGCELNGQSSFECVVGALASGSEAQLTITVLVEPFAVGPLTGSVSVSGIQEDPDPSNNDDMEETQVDRQAELLIEKEAPMTVVAGGPLSYHLVVENFGPSSATNVVVTDMLPAEVSFVSSEDCVLEASLVSCAIGGLQPNDPVELTIEVEVDSSATGPLTNSAEVWWDEGGPAMDSVNTEVSSQADLSIMKNAPGIVELDGVIRYRLILHNDGSIEAAMVEVLDQLPTESIFLSACVADGADCTSNMGWTLELPEVGVRGGLVSFSKEMLPPGAEVHFDIFVQIAEDTPVDTSISNTVTVTSDTEDSDPEDNQDSADTLVGPLPVFHKVFSPDVIAEKDISTLTFTVDNGGLPLPVMDLMFTDELLNDLEVVAVGEDTCNGELDLTALPGIISYSGGTVEAFRTCEVSVDVTSSTSGTKPNIAVLSSAAGVSTPAEATLIVLEPPLFNKEFFPEAIPLGGTSTLIFTIENGNNDAPVSELHLIDMLPEDMLVADPPGAAVGCLGGTLTAMPGTDVIEYREGTVVGASCSISVDVTSSTSEPKPNVASLMSTAGASAPATATLIVLEPPLFRMDFSRSSIPVNGTSTLTFTIDNLANEAEVDQLELTGSLGGLIVAEPAEHDCQGDLSFPGPGVIKYSNGTVGASSVCTISVVVKGLEADEYLSLASLESYAGDSGTASASLIVEPTPLFSLKFNPNPSCVGEISTLVFTIDNSANGGHVGGLAFMNELRPGLEVDLSVFFDGCGGNLTVSAPGTIEYSGGKVRAHSACIIGVGVVSAFAGEYTNWTTDLMSDAGNSGPATGTLIVTDDPSCNNLQLQCADRLPGRPAWFPFDDLGPVTAEIAHGNDGWSFSDPASAVGKVGRALRFDGIDDYVEVSDHTSVNLGEDDFTIVFWLRAETPELSDERVQSILDKRDPAIDSTSQENGYRVYFRDTRFGLQLNAAVFTHEIFFVDSEWHLMAIVVDRDNPTGGRWYLDGEPIGASFDPTVVAGSLDSSAPLRIGRSSFDDPGGYLQGDLDELQIFRRVLTGGEISSIYDAGSAGICKESLYVAPETTVCADASEALAQVAICNHSTTERDYAVSFTGLSAVECDADIDGPIDFDLVEAPSQLIHVRPRSCQLVPVRIGRPEAMIDDGQRACYRVEARDVATGSLQTRRASLRDNRIWCVVPRGDTPAGVFAGEHTPMSFEITNTTDSDTTLHWQLGVPGEDLEKAAIWLDGRPAEQMAAAELSVPAGESVELSVDVELQEHQPFGFYDLLLQDSITSRVLGSTGLRSMAFDPGTLRLHSGLHVGVEWRDFEGRTGIGQALPMQTDDSGVMWFFDADNWEMLVKVLDGCVANGHFWVFAATTTNVEYTLRVIDTETGASREYFNPLGHSAAAITDVAALPSCHDDSTISEPVAVFDTIVLPGAESSSVVERISDFTSVGACMPTATALCLGNGRFKVEVGWQNLDGQMGDAQVVPFNSDDSGLFWFFDDENWEMLVKVLDGCAINDRFWVFSAATTNVGYTLRVTDTETGRVVEYMNELGSAAVADADIEAFECSPDDPF